MSEENPYQSPRVITPRRMNWGAIISRTIGSLLLIYWLSLVVDSGILSLNLLIFSLLLLLGPSFPDLVRAPTKREVLRDMRRRAGNADDLEEPSQSPEDFLRQLERQDETA